MECPKLILLIVASSFLCFCAAVNTTKRLLSGAEDTGPSDRIDICNGRVDPCLGGNYRGEADLTGNKRCP